MDQLSGTSSPRPITVPPRARYIMAAMTGLQVLWLVVIWATGAASNAWKIPPLLVYTVLAGAAVQFAPAAFAAWMEGQVEALIRRRTRAILALAVLVVVVGGAYAGYQEVLTDEKYLMQACTIIAEEGVCAFFAGYADIGWLGGQHPPLVPLVYGLAMRVLGPQLLTMRAIAVMLTAGTVVLTYSLGARWFDSGIGLMAALFLVSMPYCLRMGTAVLTDLPVTFFFVLGLLLVDGLRGRPSYPLAVAVGVSIGLGLVSKYTMMLIYPVLLGHFAAQPRLRRASVQLAISVLASALVLGAWLAYAHSQGIFARQAQTVSRYAGVVTRGGWRYMVEMISTELTSAAGLYNLPLLFVGALSCLRKPTGTALSLLLWIVPVFAIVTLTLPDPRYFMPAFPGFAIAMALGAQQFRRWETRIVLLALLLCAGALYLFADWYRAAFLFLS